MYNDTKLRIDLSNSSSPLEVRFRTRSGQVMRETSVMWYDKQLRCFIARFLDVSNGNTFNHTEEVTSNAMLSSSWEGAVILTSVRCKTVCLLLAKNSLLVMKESFWFSGRCNESHINTKIYIVKISENIFQEKRCIYK